MRADDPMTSVDEPYLEEVLAPALFSAAIDWILEHSPEAGH